MIPGYYKRGFTLIELVIVITILGVLAAFALPRFVSLGGQARKATVEGLKGSVESAAMLAHTLQLADGISGSTSVTISGQAVTMVHGYPTADANGIIKALQSTPGIAHETNGSGIRIYPNSTGNKTTCNIQYNPPTATGNSPSVLLTVTDCS